MINLCLRWDFGVGLWTVRCHMAPHMAVKANLELMESALALNDGLNSRRAGRTGPSRFLVAEIAPMIRPQYYHGGRPHDRDTGFPGAR